MISMENPENPKCNMCKKEWKPDDTDINKNGEVYKTCKKCREQKKEYNKKNKEKLAEKAKERYKINKEKIIEKKKVYYENNKEKITEYNKEYYENNKNKLTKQSREYYENNKEELTEYQKKYNEINKEKIIEKNKVYYENNKEKIAERGKKYRENNKEKIAERGKKYSKNNKEKIAEYQKEHRRENPELLKKSRIKYIEKTKCEHSKRKWRCKICNLNMYLVDLNRVNVKRVLKPSSQNKTKSSIDYLGCDVEYFIDYFKKKMDLWNENNEIKMNWDNIHLDHIKPVSVFNLDEENELNNCCNYTNYQPLLIEDNLRKNNKWTDEDEVYWNENIINKEHFGIYIPV